MSSTRYSCQILMKLQFSRLIFEKILKFKPHENPSTEAALFHADGRDGWTDGQTDRYEEVNSRFSQFCEHS